MYFIENNPIISVILIVIIICTAVTIPVVMVDAFVSKKQADVYNQINGTDWTGKDFFWAGGQINSQTQTINLN